MSYYDNRTYPDRGAPVVEHIPDGTRVRTSSDSAIRETEAVKSAIRQARASYTEAMMREDAKTLGRALFDLDMEAEAEQRADAKLRTGEEHPEAKARIARALDILWARTDEEIRALHIERAYKAIQRVRTLEASKASPSPSSPRATGPGSGGGQPPVSSDSSSRR